MARDPQEDQNCTGITASPETSANLVSAAWKQHAKLDTDINGRYTQGCLNVQPRHHHDTREEQQKYYKETWACDFYKTNCTQRNIRVVGERESFSAVCLC